MKNFLILLALTCGQATAQVTNPIFLSCTGQYNNFKTKEEFKLQNVIIKISNDEFIIDGIPGLGMQEKYNATVKTETMIFFAHPIDQNFRGSLNRFTGFFNVSHQDSERTRSQSYQGYCQIAQKIF